MYFSLYGLSSHVVLQLCENGYGLLCCELTLLKEPSREGGALRVKGEALRSYFLRMP